MKSCNESIKKNSNPNWPYIPDHPYIIFIIDGSGILLNLIKYQHPDIDKGSLYVKDTFKSKYQLLINGREKE